jgi:hypothetical protein
VTTALGAQGISASRGSSGPRIGSVGDHREGSDGPSPTLAAEFIGIETMSVQYVPSSPGEGG